MGRRTETAKITGTRKRISFIEVTLAVFLTFLILRIYDIQKVDGDEYSRLSKSQHLVEVKGLEMRGQILDRNGNSIAGEIDVYYYFVPIEKTENDEGIKTILSQIDAEDVTGESDIYKVYRTTNYDADVCKILAQRYGAYVLKLPERKKTSEVAENLVGSFNQETGKPQSGLELAFDRQLQGKETHVSLVADSAGNLIQGYGPITDQCEKEIEVWEPFGAEGSAKGDDIETTLDLEFQRKCENEIDKHILKDNHEAVCIVTDTDTGEILVMAQKGRGKTENPALEREMSMGEMDDFLIYACALEKGQTPDESTGKNFEQEWFSNLAASIGYEALLEKCYKLGFGQRCLDFFPSEAKGYLPYAEEITPQNIDSLTNISNPIMVTPIQVAKAATILARGGRNVDLKLLKDDRVDNADEQETICVFEKDLVEKTLKEFQSSWGVDHEKIMKVMGIENVFAWQSEDAVYAGEKNDISCWREGDNGSKECDTEEIKNFWMVGELQNFAKEDGNAEREENNRHPQTKRYTILVVVRGGAECESIAEKIFLKVCS